MNRTVNVVRMQLINQATYIWVPLMVLGGSLLVTLAVFGILSTSGVEGPFYGGGAQAPLWYFIVVGVQALTLTFPFSQAMSVTRREFFLGTLLTAAITAAILSVIFVIGGFIEQATGGWGIQGYFFRLPWVWEHGPLAAALFFFTVTMFVFTVGFWAATIYKRFGSIVLTSVMVGIAALLVLAMFLIGQAQAWGEVWGWFASQSAIGLMLWGLVATAVLAVISYGTLRRAVP